MNRILTSGLLAVGALFLSACASTQQAVPESKTRTPERFVAQEVLKSLGTVDDAQGF